MLRCVWLLFGPSCRRELDVVIMPAVRIAYRNRVDLAHDRRVLTVLELVARLTADADRPQHLVLTCIWKRSTRRSVCTDRFTPFIVISVRNSFEVFLSITRESVVHSPSGVPKQPHSPSRGDLPKRLEELFL